MKFERLSVINHLPRIIRSGACQVVDEDTKRCRNRAAYVTVDVTSNTKRTIVIRVCEEHANDFERRESRRLEDREKLWKRVQDQKKQFAQIMKDQHQRERHDIGRDSSAGKTA